MPYIAPADDLRATHTPNYDIYLKRQKFLATRGLLRTDVPTGFPSHVESPSVWSGESLDIEKLTYDLSPTEIREVEEALQAFKNTGTSLNDISSNNFWLPSLSLRLLQVSNQIYKGKGIAIIRGMQPDAFSVEDNIIIHAGISTYIAPLRGSQSGSNDQVFHICNREDMPISDLKSTSTADSLPFHTDDTDILAFYAIETAMSGGEMQFASQCQVFNELAANRPEVLGTLAENQWPLQTLADPPNFVRMPTLYTDRSGPFFWLARGNYTGTPRTLRSPDIPGITYKQADALDAVHFAAIKHTAKVAPKKGEMYFINNFSVLHARAAFKDDRTQDDSHPRGRRRHLLRLWLRNPALGREFVEPTLKRRWQQVFNPESAMNGRWLLFRDMKLDVVSDALFKGNFPKDTFSSCSNN